MEEAHTYENGRNMQYLVQQASYSAIKKEKERRRI